MTIGGGAANIGIGLTKVSLATTGLGMLLLVTAPPLGAALIAAGTILGYSAFGAQAYAFFSGEDRSYENLALSALGAFPVFGATAKLGAASAGGSRALKMLAKADYLARPLAQGDRLLNAGVSIWGLQGSN